MQEVFDVLVPALASALLALAGLAVNRLADWLKLSADDKVRGYLHDAVGRAIEMGVASARARLAFTHSADEGIDPVQEATAEAAGYLRGQVPDALARFGLDDDRLARLIQARMREDGTLPTLDAVPR